MVKIIIKNKIKKQDIILFICIWIFSIVVNNAFLQRHYSSDTMCLIDLGYFQYPLQFFLLDGRIVSTLVCFLGGIFKLPLDIYLFISYFIGIMLLALSVMLLFKFTIKYLNIENKWIKFMALLAIYTIIFNHMDIEYFIFQECCVMCAGILFSVIAAIKYLEDKQGKEYKSFIFLLIATLCYQGLLSIFPTIVITLSLLKKKDLDKKEISRFYIKNILIIAIMYILVMLISAVLICIFNNILDSTTNRLERVKYIFAVLKMLPGATIKILFNQINRIPKFLSIIVMGITIIITIKNNNLTYKYILTIITAYVFSVLPLLVFGYVHARLLMSIGATMGISLLFIIRALEYSAKSISIKNIDTLIISICVISYFIFNVVNNYINGYEHLKSCKQDEEMGKEIATIVKEYEEETGNEITKFAYCEDFQAEGRYDNLKYLGPLTERKFAVPVKESINYYCNKKLEFIEEMPEVYLKYFTNKDYKEFAKEQFVLVGDTLLMCVY